MFFITFITSEISSYFKWKQFFLKKILFQENNGLREGFRQGGDLGGGVRINLIQENA